MVFILERFLVLGFVILIFALLVFFIINAYNQLVKAQNRVNTQWSQIDVQLMRRSDLIPNLVETVKSYTSYEKEVLEKLVEARNALSSAVSPSQSIASSDRLSEQLQHLLAVAEAYPDLKADKVFIKLQSSLNETEDKIAYARQFYNDTVLSYKNKLHMFPSNIIAKKFHFNDTAYYIANADEKHIVSIHK